ncbi:hypothetical protein DYB26_007052 [Aphanomyces astaci]|uniref:CDC20/Fizzy WD40 domain-containing protein n=1 Tax=Aphanomyces astaci TaxID=112090 RepID=A0A397A502_APHAT|nr:hypothetical protein DYB36_005426 [Aphanomyces astaci]RHZ32661.1 hypothetical protein DYB26_007052 [Aphanomyces astaci]
MDRYIPNRSAMNMDVSAMHVCEHATPSMGKSTPYHQALTLTMFGVPDLSAVPVYKLTNNAANPMEQGSTPSSVRRVETGVVKTVSALRIMDAPMVENDFYLNLLDWGEMNVLAIALGKSVHLWDHQKKSHSQLVSYRNNIVTSLKWGISSNRHLLAVGIDNGTAQVWDTQTKLCITRIGGHIARVGSMAWRGPTLTTGSLDNTIAHHDPRMPNHQITMLRHHTGEICGLEWSPDERMLVSGGSDHVACVWSKDFSRTTPLHVITAHTAAVKALRWSPWDVGILATGGGSSDKTIKRWRITERTCKLQHSVDTMSQVSGLVWSQPELHHSKQLLSSHGPVSNTIKLWDVGGMALIKEYGGHARRILNMAASPDGSAVATLSADETLHFWPGFDAKLATKKRPRDDSSLLTGLLR